MATCTLPVTSTLHPQPNTLNPQPKILNEILNPHHGDLHIARDALAGLVVAGEPGKDLLNQVHALLRRQPADEGDEREVLVDLYMIYILHTHTHTHTFFMTLYTPPL